MAGSTTQKGQAYPNAFALIIVVLALLVQTGYQTYRLLNERNGLQTRLLAQESTVEEARNVRAQLESLAGQTALLAQLGNANAQHLVDQLRAQGIAIRPPSNAGPLPRVDPAVDPTPATATNQ